MKFCSPRCNIQFHVANRRNTTAAHFWAKVAVGAPNDCWEWTGTKDTHGYGQIRWRGKMRLAHRLALSLTDGDWNSRLLVCHSCDVPACCNPAHLWRGTYRDNTQDAIKKERFRTRPAGEINPSAKLAPDQVLAIRSNNAPTPEAAARFGVSYATIRDIRKRRTWRHLL